MTKQVDPVGMTAPLVEASFEGASDGTGSPLGSDWGVVSSDIAQLELQMEGLRSKIMAIKEQVQELPTKEWVRLRSEMMATKEWVNDQFGKRKEEALTSELQFQESLRSEMMAIKEQFQEVPTKEWVNDQFGKRKEEALTSELQRQEASRSEMMAIREEVFDNGRKQMKELTGMTRKSSGLFLVVVLWLLVQLVGVVKAKPDVELQARKTLEAMTMAIKEEVQEMPTKAWVNEKFGKLKEEALAWERSEMMAVKEEVQEMPTKAWVIEKFGKLKEEALAWELKVEEASRSEMMAIKEEVQEMPTKRWVNEQFAKLKALIWELKVDEASRSEMMAIKQVIQEMPTKLWVLEASRSEMMVIKDEVKEKPTKAWVNEQFGKLSGNITKAAPAAPLAPPTGELEAKAACYHEVLKLEEKLEQKENETGVGDAALQPHSAKEEVLTWKLIISVGGPLACLMVMSGTLFVVGDAYRYIDPDFLGVLGMLGLAFCLAAVAIIGLVHLLCVLIALACLMMLSMMASGAVVALYTAPDAPLPLKLPTFFYRLGIVGLFFCLASVVIIGLMNLVRAFVCSTPLGSWLEC